MKLILLTLCLMHAVHPAACFRLDQLTMANIALQFKVYGKVQGVFFRKHTKKQADRLGLTGWVMNDSDGTVVGEVEGPTARVGQMKQWLTSVGSPKSKIERCEFTDEYPVQQAQYSAFVVRR